MSDEKKVQALLRLLTGPARIPLASALTKAKILLAAGLTTPEKIIAADIEELERVFPEERTRKAVLSGCRRLSGPKPPTKRPGRGPSPTFRSPSPLPLRKRRRHGDDATVGPSALALPEPATENEGLLMATALVINRAPLHLVFALVTLEYTYPSLSVSSRLSLAGGVIAANALTKARSIGMVSGEQGAEDKRLFTGGERQPVLKVMGRGVKCLRRYDETSSSPGEEVDGKIPGSNGAGSTTSDGEPQYWALDLEELSKPASSSNLPFHAPESTLSYLSRSFDSASPSPKPLASKSRIRRKSQDQQSSLPLILGALHLLLRSWKDHVTGEELDRRSWEWYCSVRPEVPQGAAGWGSRGDVKLADILDLRRKN